MNTCVDRFYVECVTVTTSLVAGWVLPSTNWYYLFTLKDLYSETICNSVYCKFNINKKWNKTLWRPLDIYNHDSKLLNCSWTENCSWIKYPWILKYFLSQFIFQKSFVHASAILPLWNRDMANIKEGVVFACCSSLAILCKRSVAATAFSSF